MNFQAYDLLVVCTIVSRGYHLLASEVVFAYELLPKDAEWGFLSIVRYWGKPKVYKFPKKTRLGKTPAGDSLSVENISSQMETLHEYEWEWLTV